ncbi:MAG TPA: PAS domain-containing sensor histidine kinase [Alphaproteobacteria bacterium]|nr:PAS domain-containing sensor histidine kinase [Alphaproteobacteria bacterium]
MKQNSGWLSSNIAQLMVFLNGLILTITAFATLSVFIDEIIKERLVKMTEEVQEHFVSGYKGMETSLYALSTIVSMSDDISVDQLADYFSQNNNNNGYYDQIYWIEKRDDGQWDAISLLAGNDYVRAFGSSEAFLKFILNETGVSQREMYFVTSLPENEQWQDKEEDNVFDKAVVLIKPEIKDGQISGYLAGFSRINNFIGQDWLEKRESLASIQVIDSITNNDIYSYQGVSSKKYTEGYMSFFPTVFADKPIELDIEVIINDREAFLQKIPLLMLLFGITLTLIGTLYVRNNQSQSQKLAQMNKELAHKNFELNQEVTERERLNQVIQKSARENRAIINAVSDIIFELSIDGTILFLNAAWKNVTGFEQERSIGRNIFDLIYVQDQEEQRQNFDQLVKGQKKSYRAFTRLRSADGTFRAVELAISMLRQDENREMRVVGTITDVEERRRAERALSEAEKKYRAIVENAAGGIYQVTPEGQFLSANPAFAKIIGYDTPEQVLRDINKAQEQLYVDKHERDRFLRDIATLDAPRNIEVQIYKKNGDVIWVSENVRPVKDDDGTLLFYEGSMDDVDQRKKAELALKEAKTESDLANRAKSEFLANMSHELRTPLNSVIGFSEIIKNETFGPLPQKEYKEYATDIFESGNKLLKVINEILDVSRIEAGERTLNETVISVEETVKSCLGLMETKIKTNQMRVENKVQNSSIRFIAEKQAVKQMLLNLMSNAVKYSPPNSFMMLDAEIDSKGRLRLSVTDTGIGLNEAELEKALSPFGQVDADHNRAKSGTGLGLTLVKSLIELHGGELEIVSQKGIGTTATLIFPAKRVAQNKAGETVETVPPAEGDDMGEQHVNVNETETRDV